MYEFSGEKDTEAYLESPENAFNILHELFSGLSQDALKDLQIIICGAVSSEKYKKELYKKLASLGSLDNEINTVIRNLNHDLWEKTQDLYHSLSPPENAFEDKRIVDDVVELLSERVISVFEAIPGFYEALEELFPAIEDKENASIALSLLQAGRLSGDETLYDGLLSKQQLRFLKKYSNSELDMFEEFLEHYLD